MWDTSASLCSAAAAPGAGKLRLARLCEVFNKLDGRIYGYALGGPPIKCGYATSINHRREITKVTTNLPLSGKTILVTGAARRLGAAMVRAFHGAGANVAIHYRASAGEATALCEALNEARPGSAMTLALDLNDTARLPDLPAGVQARFGALDGLVNNASNFYPTKVGDITEDNWNDLMGSNLKAPAFLTQAAAPLLQNARGFVINMVDIHALRPLDAHPVYCAAKAGLNMLTRSFARELGPHVRVNGIAPGPVLWPESAMSESAKSSIVQNTALQRCGDESDIVQAALYLATAGFVTGQIIAVDGGRSI